MTTQTTKRRTYIPTTKRRTYTQTRPTKNLENNSDKIRIIPLGGVEEIGRNMTAIEYKNNIVVFDIGLQFPDGETPGIDYILPNTKYLEDRKHKIKCVVLSHGHLDHIGGVPYLMERIGNPIIYTTKLTKAMVLKRQEEFPHNQNLHIQEITASDKINLDKGFGLKFFDVTHTIPDAIGTILETPLGNIVYPGDAKIGRDDKGNPIGLEAYEKLGKEKVLALLLESTNSEKPGFSIGEDIVQRNLEKLFGEAKGRIIVGTFASQIERIVEIVKIAEKLKRKVVIDGFSMKSNLEIANKLGFFKPKQGTIISPKEIDKYPDNKILALCTGAQGEEYAALMRIANNRHAHIKLHEGDTVVLSSSIIPGNEKNIQNLKDNLARQNAKVIHYEVAEIHASGHAYSEELKLMIKAMNPKFFIPVHGRYFMLKTNALLAESMGVPKKNIGIAIRNGAIIEVSKNSIGLSKEKAPANYVMVDGLGVGDVKEVVLRDRQMLAQDGIFVIIAVIDTQTGKVKGSPDIISRGFVYLRESQDLLKSARYIIRKIAEETANMHPVNMTYVKDQIRERVGKYLFQKTKRRPMVLPVVIEV
ncbi:MAG: ribonuclease J [Candidatus Marinimicrobia bacterium]|nr:ribonuclease J [Candidatus Neomarinimicrobiota bacterium]